jgi:hypothetical protein
MPETRKGSHCAACPPTTSGIRLPFREGVKYSPGLRAQIFLAPPHLFLTMRIQPNSLPDFITATCFSACSTVLGDSPDNRILVGPKILFIPGDAIYVACAAISVLVSKSISNQTGHDKSNRDRNELELVCDFYEYCADAYRLAARSAFSASSNVWSNQS